MAKTLLRERGIENVSVSVGDASATGLPDASFRFVHERLLLIVVPEPEKVVAEMARLAEPGGVVALEDVDIDSWNCEPPHPAWERLLAAVETVYARDGKDLRIGRRLPGLLRAAGLANVGCKPHARVNGPGDFHQQQLLIFVKMFWRRIVELGLVAEPKLKLLFMDLEAHLAQPGTMVISPTLFQAWGEKPRGTSP
jgi:SAM-dependent methyltransferase